MGYQALLFCPDEKTARTVTQVLSELEFDVIPCTEPFAAVKKLMGQHFDAVVVDCDNEQNATLLFKSARNTTDNQSSLAIAVVEGQAGVAKAFRIGANLVLTKPINVEQAKGTLRVARGLLRKSEGAKPATAAPSSIKPATPAPEPDRPAQQTAISSIDRDRPTANLAPLPIKAPVSFPVQKSAPPPAAMSSAPEGIGEGVAGPESSGPTANKTAVTSPADVGSSPVGSSPASLAGFGTSAASAPAPARELKPSVSNEGRSPIFVDAGSPAGNIGDAGGNTFSSATMPTPTPSFSFGGAVESGAESGRGGSKKVLLGVVALVVLAAAGYGAWMHWGRSGADEAVPAHVAESATSSAAAPNTAPAAVPQGKPRAAPVSAPSQSTSGSFAASQPTSAADAQVSGGKTSAHSSKDGSETTLEKPSASTVASNKIPSAIEAEQPIVIKNGVSKPAKAAANSDTLAPSITNIPVTGSAALPALMGVNKTATPVLQRLSISQGVSRGLLIKQVQPSYPANALRMHIEGSVQLMTTLSKNGDITAIKVMSGDKQLAQAAVSAVKQWKYKPYLLNGEPVEIQTEVTVNFKLPR